MMKPINPIQSEKGMATIETVPLLVLFVFLTCYLLGAFGIVHTAIMNSIAARTYAFDTFRNRTNLTYFRDTEGALLLTFRPIGARTHGIANELRQGNSDSQEPSERYMPMGKTIAEQGRTPAMHNTTISTIVTGKQNQNVAVNPAWTKITYGICLNAACNASGQ